MHYYKKRFTLILFVLVGLIFSSCTKEWLNVNYNPDDLTNSETEPYLMVAAILSSASGQPVKEDEYLQNWMGYWCRPGPTALGVWDQIYDIRQVAHVTSKVGIDDIIFLEQLSRQKGQTFYLGIAKVMEALQNTAGVDLINDFPYTQVSDPNITKPKYDKGQFIYEDCMRGLDSALTFIKQADIGINVNITSYDIMFFGDKNKWYRFINTVKLRLLVHQANRPERTAYIQAEIAKIQNSGYGFLASGEDAAVNPGFRVDKLNDYYKFYSRFNPSAPSLSIGPGGVFGYTWQNASANTTSMNFLKNTNDPRLGLFYDSLVVPFTPGAPEPFMQAAPNNYRANEFGLQVDGNSYPFQIAAYISQIKGNSAFLPISTASTGILKGYDMNQWVLTSIESFFLQAEAVQRGWIPGDPEQAYKNAVQESFRWLNAGGNSENPALSDAIFSNWYAGEVSSGDASVSWQDSPDKYKLLMLQKWAAFNGIEPHEAYTDYRRNGSFPNLPLSLDPGRLKNSLPIRQYYPIGEYERNADNVNAEGAIDPFTSKIWWMP